MKAIRDAAKAVSRAVTNPIQTATNIISAPVKLVNHIVNTANSLDEMPIKVGKELERYGKYDIVKILVFREPVASAVKAGVKILTLGKLHTDIRHVFEVFVLQYESKPDSIVYLRMEKNETVATSVLPKTVFDKLVVSTEHVEVVVHETLLKFMDRYVQRTNPKVLWLYDPITANCQVFVYLGLVANGLSSTAAHEDFIVQASVRDEISSEIATVMKGITTAANYARRFVGADGPFADSEHSSTEHLLNLHAEVVYACTQWILSHPDVMSELCGNLNRKRSRISY